MDHVPRPLRPSSVLPRILNRCNDPPYDDGNFYTYPDRVSRTDIIFFENGRDFAFRTRSQELKLADINDYEKLLQSWCFFGLLQHFLSPLGLYDHRDYIDGEYIHTRVLTQRFEAWRNGVRQYDIAARTALVEGTQQCWRLIHPALRALDNSCFAQFDQDLKWCLLLLCHLINKAVSEICGRDINWTTSPPACQLSTSDKALMLQHGWCISEITRVEHKCSMLPGLLWYLRNMARSELDHSDCNVQQCQRAQIDERYQIKHTQSCNCALLGPDMDQLLQCLVGSYPVVDTTRDGVEILSAAEIGERSYVAISHIWADGLGNPEGNTLPACQVARLKSMVRALEGRSFDHLTDWRKYDKLHLWIDSICVPVQGPVRLHAIDQLREVYSKAAYVLVVDEELMTHSFAEIGTMEAGTRFLNSRYMGRLWTFQEAGLADKLLIQFRDGAVDTLTIRQAALQARSLVFRNQTDDALNIEIAFLRAWKNYRSPDGLYRVVHALYRRQVSVSSDEAICIAAIYGFGIADVAKGGMPQFWRMLDRTYGISESVIFSIQPRLEVPGFRWAAATFLQTPVPGVDVDPVDKVSYFRRLGRQLDPIQLFEDVRPGVLTARGLRVRRPGWKIERPKRDAAMTGLYEGSSRLPLTFATINGQHYNIMAQQDLGDPLEMVQEGEWYIILERASSWTGPHQKGLVVSAAVQEYGLVYYRSRMVVHVSRLTPALEVSRQADFLYAESILRSWTASALRMMHSVESWLPLRTGYLRKQLQNRFVKMSSMALTEAANLPEVARLMQTVNQQEMVTLGGQHLQALKGDYLKVIELNEDTEWYVD